MYCFVVLGQLVKYKDAQRGALVYFSYARLALAITCSFLTEKKMREGGCADSMARTDLCLLLADGSTDDSRGEVDFVGAFKSSEQHAYASAATATGSDMKLVCRGVTPDLAFVFRAIGAQKRARRRAQVRR
jgi:hypothetical protein